MNPLDELRSEYSTLETEELTAIVGADSHQYRPEAVRVAEEELLRRGVPAEGTADLRHKIDTERQERLDREGKPLSTVLRVFFLLLPGLPALITCAVMASKGRKRAAREAILWAGIGIAAWLVLSMLLSGLTMFRPPGGESGVADLEAIRDRDRYFQLEVLPMLDDALRRGDEIVLVTDPNDIGELYYFNKVTGELQDSLLLMQLKYLKANGMNPVDHTQLVDAESGIDEGVETYTLGDPFLEAVHVAFHAIIEEYGFSVTGRGSQVHLEAFSCTIVLQFEFYDLEASLGNPASGADYLVDSLMLFRGMSLAVGEENLSRPEGWSRQADRSLEAYALILESGFADVLSGDFSWERDYRRHVDELSRLFERIWALETEDEEYRRFAGNDMSWMEDVMIVSRERGPALLLASGNGSALSESPVGQGEVSELPQTEREETTRQEEVESAAEQSFNAEADAVARLRDAILSRKALDPDLIRELVTDAGAHDSNDTVLCVVMDRNAGGGTVVTVISWIDGSTSLYFNSGGGYVGVNSYESVAQAARRFRDLATALREEMAPVDSFPLPTRQSTEVFYLVTKARTFASRPIHSGLNGLEPDHPFAALDESAQSVITEVRRAVGWPGAG